MSKSTTKVSNKNWKPDPDITPKKLDDMRSDVLERIIVARIGLLLRHPFFGNMATRLRIKSADAWLPTAAVDGRNLYFNTQFFNAMDNKEIEFVIAHEILHCAFDHLDRRNDRDHQLYNIAADYIVNNTLVRENIGSVPKVVNCYQDFKYEGWTSEEVYDDLYKNAEKIDIGTLGELLDEHLEGLDEGDGEGDDSSNSDGGNKSNKKPVYSKEQLRQIKEQIKENMMSAAQAAGAGNTPGAIQRMIKELTEPKMNWRELLQQQIQSTMKSDYTFSRPNRKGQQSGSILPSMNFATTIDICVALDLSGSISESQIRDFLGEIQGIMEEYQDYHIKLWTFDTQVYGEEDFEAGDGKELIDYALKGNGGTDFMCNWHYMKENDINPKKFIMFTDMGCWGEWGDETYCDTVFINHGSPGTVAPFGVTAEYTE